MKRRPPPFQHRDGDLPAVGTRVRHADGRTGVVADFFPSTLNLAARVMVRVDGVAASSRDSLEIWRADSVKIVQVRP